MSWGRMFLLGNVGQQIDIEDIEADVERLRARLHEKQSTDGDQDKALVVLRQEVTDLKLVVAELARLLVAGGTLPAEAVDRIVRSVDRGSPP
jgi:hypothetical protein